METKYKILNSIKEVKQLIKACKKMGYCCNDFETNARPIYREDFKITILSVSFMPGFGCAIPLDHFQAEEYYESQGIQFPRHQRLKAIKMIGHQLIENPNVTKVAWNFKFDGQIWEKILNIYYRGTLLDGMIMKYLLNEERPHDLKDMVRRYLPDVGDYEKAEKFEKVPWDKKELVPLCFYGCQDTDYTLRLSLFFERKLIDIGMYNTYRNLFATASRVLTSVEKCGLALDTDFNNQLLVSYKEKVDAAYEIVMNLPRVKKFAKLHKQEKIDNYLSKIQAELDELNPDDPKDTRKISSREQKIANIKAGVFTTKTELALLDPPNLNSNITLPTLMYTHPKGFKFPILKYTESGGMSTDEDTLVQLRLTIENPNCPKAIFLDKLLELRGLEKMYKTYIFGWNEKVQSDSHLHGRINIVGCVTGDTQLVLRDSNVPIETISPTLPGVMDVTDKQLWVLSHNSRYEQITHTINKGVHPTYIITTAKGKTLKCTKHHKLLTPMGMKRVSVIFKKRLPIICHDTSQLDNLSEKPFIQGRLSSEVQVKDIPGWPGYIASSEGKVYSVKVQGKWGTFDYNNPHEMTARPGRMGVPRVWLRKRGSSKRYPHNVSSLVWSAFNGQEVPEGMIIDHINCDRTDNRIENLQCITYSENTQRSYQYTRTATQRATNSKYDAQFIGRVLNYHLNNPHVSRADIAREFNIKPMQVTRILEHRTWGYIYLDEIVSMEYIGEYTIYDLSVNNAHSYIIRDNFISSNTDSNRYSSADPNIQQIPKTSVDPNIKKQLIAPKGKLYLAYDYSQAELRMMAHLSGDETYLKAFREGVDPHLAIAINKYHASPEEAIEAYEDETHPDHKIWEGRRKQAKQIAFGLIYGIGPGLLAEKLSDPKAGLIVSKEEAKQVMDEFFTEHPKIKKFKDKQERLIRKQGYYKQLFGTKRRLPQIWGDDQEQIAYAIRLGLNFNCQGPAANMTNFGSVLIYWLMRQGKLPRMEECCTVHDSVYQYTLPQYINVWTVYTIWNILRNPSTKHYFGFQIKDVEMSMDFSIGRTMAEELPFIPLYDYTKMLSPDFLVEEYMEEHRKWRNKRNELGFDPTYPGNFPKIFKKEMKRYEQEFLKQHSE